MGKSRPFLLQQRIERASRPIPLGSPASSVQPTVSRISEPGSGGGSVPNPHELAHEARDMVARTRPGVDGREPRSRAGTNNLYRSAASRRRGPSRIRRSLLVVSKFVVVSLAAVGALTVGRYLDGSAGHAEAPQILASANTTGTPIRMTARSDV